MKYWTVICVPNGLRVISNLTFNLLPYSGEREGGGRRREEGERREGGERGRGRGGREGEGGSQCITTVQLVQSHTINTVEYV